MAGLIYEVNIPQAALTAGSPQLVGYITAPAAQRVKIKAYGFFFDGVVNSATPVQITLSRPTTLGSLTPTSAIKTEQGLPEAVQSAVGVSATTQPTIANVFKTITVHPQLGYEYISPLGEEEQLEGGATFVASATAATGVTVNIRGYIRAEE